MGIPNFEDGLFDKYVTQMPNEMEFYEICAQRFKKRRTLMFTYWPKYSLNMMKISSFTIIKNCAKTVDINEWRSDLW